MLFKQAILERIRRREVKVAFRRWRRPTVQPGTRLHTAIGLLAIEAVDEIPETAVTEAEARDAGYLTPADLFATMPPTGTHFRIAFRHAGEDPRISLRKNTRIDEALLRRLARLDAASKTGPWTQRVLRLIDTYPEKRAADLSARLKLEKEWFKLSVRKLKNLGLTESLEVGYRLSPKGRALLKKHNPVTSRPAAAVVRRLNSGVTTAATPKLEQGPRCRTRRE